LLKKLRPCLNRPYWLLESNMTIRVAINGYGRIGRNVLRAHYEYKKHPDIQIVALNDISNPEVSAHLTRYDTTHGPFHGEIGVTDDHLLVNGDKIRLLANREVGQLPWQELGIDMVLECTGHYTSGSKAKAHLQAGAKKVLISAPGTEVDATIVYGVNHRLLQASHTIVSNASCTTNCLAPLVQPLDKTLGIASGLMTTIHAFTNDQVILDANHSDLRRARCASQSMIPTKTGAAAALGLVLPELEGKLDGFAMRVPTINVSVVDLTFVAKRTTSVEEVNAILRQAAEGELKEVLGYNTAPLVSVDFNHNPLSCIFDATQTRVIGSTVKVLAWYDNEWGFSNRMLDTAKAMMQV
jgi:glyceraldehyde 3-phosphate dehydrogenase